MISRAQFLRGLGGVVADLYFNNGNATRQLLLAMNNNGDSTPNEQKPKSFEEIIEEEIKTQNIDFQSVNDSLYKVDPRELSYIAGSVFNLADGRQLRVNVTSEGCAWATRETRITVYGKDHTYLLVLSDIIKDNLDIREKNGVDAVKKRYNQVNGIYEAILRTRINENGEEETHEFSRIVKIPLFSVNDNIPASFDETITYHVFDDKNRKTFRKERKDVKITESNITKYDTLFRAIFDAKGGYSFQNEDPNRCRAPLSLKDFYEVMPSTIH